MARPTKHNADYFSHDIIMRDDPKIKALRRKYSHIGYSIWNMMLELLTSKEYFEYQWNELNIELLAPDFDIDSDDLKDIIEYCIKLGLLQFTNGYIHCDKLTFRLEESVLLRRKGYCSNNALRNTINVNINPVSVNINTESKVKESKANEIKEKDSKAKQSEVPVAVNALSKSDFSPMMQESEFDSVFND